MTEPLDEHNVLTRQLITQFLAEGMESNALDICALRNEFTPDDLRLLDSAAARVYEAMVGLARRNVAPTITEVHVALMNAGALGNSVADRGYSVKDRMLAATTAIGHPERLFDTAAHLLTVIFRNRLDASASALASAAWGMSVPDAFDLFLREGAMARDLRERIIRLEAAVGRWHGAKRGEVVEHGVGHLELSTGGEAA